MPTPTIYTEADRQVFGDLDESLQSNELELLYPTDRMRKTGEDGALGYGSERSDSLAFGTAIAKLGEDVTWEPLLAASRTGQRPADIQLSMGGITELGRAPETPMPYRAIDGEIIEDPEALAERAAAVAMLR